MANILYPPPRPQSVGEILDLAVRVFSATLLKCVPYSLTAVIVGRLPTIYDLATGHSVPQALGLQQSHDARWWTLLCLAVLGATTLSNAVLLRQYALATGHRAASGNELATGARKTPGIVLIGLLIGLAVFVTFLPAAALLGLTVAGIGTAPTKAAALVGFLAVVLILLLICASWAITRWICSGAAYLLTDRGPLASMSYSWQLTKGSFWRLSAIYAVGMVLMIVFYLVSLVIGGFVGVLFAHGDVAMIVALSAVLMALLGALVIPFYSALVLAVFGDVLVRRQGVDLEQRISAQAPS